MKSWFCLKDDVNMDVQLAMDIIDINDREKVALLMRKALNFKNGGGFDVDYKIINPLTRKAG